MSASDTQTGQRNVEALVRAAKVLVVDDEFYSRKVIRTLLMAIGVGDVHDASDCRSGLDAIRMLAPDVVILDWEMPGMTGADFVRHVRNPTSFPYPDVPIIMLTGHSERSRVLEAIRLGAHEYLVKPVSSAALHARIVSVLTKPRVMVRRGDFYGPEPRRFAAYKPDAGSYDLRAEQVVDKSPAYKIFV
jgi:CheY-like chemotaxis protein